MLEATDFIQINFLGKLSTSSLREKYQLRDKKYSPCAKPLVYFFMRSITDGVSRPSWGARCNSAVYSQLRAPPVQGCCTVPRNATQGRYYEHHTNDNACNTAESRSSPRQSGGCMHSQHGFSHRQKIWLAIKYFFGTRFMDVKDDGMSL